MSRVKGVDCENLTPQGKCAVENEPSCVCIAKTVRCGCAYPHKHLLEIKNGIVKNE